MLYVEIDIIDVTIKTNKKLTYGIMFFAIGIFISGALLPIFILKVKDYKLTVITTLLTVLLFVVIGICVGHVKNTHALTALIVNNDSPILSKEIQNEQLLRLYITAASSSYRIKNEINYLQQGRQMTDKDFKQLKEMVRKKNTLRIKNLSNIDKIQLENIITGTVILYSIYKANDVSKFSIESIKDKIQGSHSPYVFFAYFLDEYSRKKSYNDSSIDLSIVIDHINKPNVNFPTLGMWTIAKKYYLMNIKYFLNNQLIDDLKQLNETLNNAFKDERNNIAFCIAALESITDSDTFKQIDDLTNKTSDAIFTIINSLKGSSTDKMESIITRMENELGKINTALVSYKTEFLGEEGRDNQGRESDPQSESAASTDEAFKESAHNEPEEGIDKKLPLDEKIVENYESTYKKAIENIDKIVPKLDRSLLKLNGNSNDEIVEAMTDISDSVASITEMLKAFVSEAEHDNFSAAIKMANQFIPKFPEMKKSLDEEMQTFKLYGNNLDKMISTMKRFSADISQFKTSLTLDLYNCRSKQKCEEEDPPSSNISGLHTTTGIPNIKNR